MADSPISRRSLQRQINREGDRWDLVADDGAEERRMIAEAVVGLCWEMDNTGLGERVDEDLVDDALEHFDADQTIGVACRTYEAEVHYGLGEIAKRGMLRLCSVDDEHPFSAALHCRIKNGETDMAAPYKEARRQRKIADARAAEEKNAEARAIWRTRKQIIALPGLDILPAGLRERARRRQE